MHPRFQAVLPQLAADLHAAIAPMLADPHFAARDALVTIPDAELGEIRMQGVFPKLSATPGSVRRPELSRFF